MALRRAGSRSTGAAALSKTASRLLSEPEVQEALQRFRADARLRAAADFDLALARARQVLEEDGPEARALWPKAWRFLSAVAGMDSPHEATVRVTAEAPPSLTMAHVLPTDLPPAGGVEPRAAILATRRKRPP